MELLYAYNKPFYKESLYDRLNGIISDFNKICDTCYNNKKEDINYLVTISYLVSTMQALELIDLYINSNNKIKKEILIAIQKVFDNKITLEESLFKFDINYESSKDTNILKRLI